MNRHRLNYCFATALSLLALCSDQSVAAEGISTSLAKANEIDQPSVKTIEVRTAGELHAALAAAEPGATLLLHQGVYEGIFTLTRGGRPEAPVTIRPAGDGVVKITNPPNSLTAPSREGNSGANLSRTFRILKCSDVVVENLSIHGGIMIGDEGNHRNNPAWREAGEAFDQWAKEDGPAQKRNCIATISKNQWIKTIGVVRGRVGPGTVGWMDGKFPPTTQRITIAKCDITGRGIGLWSAGACKIERNVIHDVEPYIPGIVLQFICMGNDVIGNDVSGMYDPKCHWQGEGIRLVNGCCDNYIAENQVHDIKGLGFGITTDLFCDNNTIAHNRVARIQNIAFTAQAWDSDNKWINNIAEDANIGFEFSSWWWNDESDNQPTSGCEVRGNRAYRCTNADAAAARINGYRFSDNNFKRVHFSPNLIKTFAAGGGLWDGLSVLPDWISAEPPKRELKFDF